MDTRTNFKVKSYPDTSMLLPASDGASKVMMQAASSNGGNINHDKGAEEAQKHSDTPLICNAMMRKGHLHRVPGYLLCGAVIKLHETEA